MRYTIKETPFIDTKFLNKHHCFEHDVRQGQYTCFWNKDGQEVKSTINFEMSTVIGDCYIHLKDIESDQLPGFKTNIDCKVTFVSTPCHFGGKRWWFNCPVVVNGQVCNRRVGVLYLPSGKEVFGCRRCHNLAYVRSTKGYKYAWEGNFQKKV